MSIKKVLIWLFRIFATFYVLDGSFKLMTMPNDLTFIGGMAALAFLGWIWYYIVAFEVKKFKERFKEKNETSFD